MRDWKSRSRMIGISAKARPPRSRSLLSTISVRCTRSAASRGTKRNAGSGVIVIGPSTVVTLRAPTGTQSSPRQIGRPAASPSLKTTRRVSYREA